MKLTISVGEIDAKISVNGVTIAEHHSDPQSFAIDTTQKVKLIDGYWCYWEIEQPMPTKLTVYRGSWEQRRRVGWCTRQHAAAIAKRDGNDGVWYTCKDGRSADSTVSFYLAGDVDTFYGDDDENNGDYAMIGYGGEDA